jgi:hypothetical protein
MLQPCARPLRQNPMRRDTGLRRTTMDPNWIPFFGMTFSIGLPMAAVIIWIILRYRRQRRLLELHHVERMAAIERGMEVPPLPPELLSGRGPRRRRTSLLPGLIWFFVGLAVVVGSGSIDDMPVMTGLIPLGIGLAYLIYYFTEGRKIEARQLDHELQDRNSQAGANSTPAL